MAEKGRELLRTRNVTILKGLKPLPRPMLHSGDLDFSFSGIKTAVKYLARDLGDITEDQKKCIAADFEDAVIEVMLGKTKQALELHPTHSFMLGGGVSANTRLRNKLTVFFKDRPDTTLFVPAEGLSTDNAVMIGMAGYLCHLRNAPTLTAQDTLDANGTLPLPHSDTQDTATE